MICLARVDDRLVHGQVTVGWAPHLHASRITVINDRLAGNPVLTAILKAGASEGMEIDVVSVDESARLYREGGFSTGSVIVLFESLDDARRALTAGLRFHSLNIGGLRRSGEGRRISDAVVLSDADQEILRDLGVRGVEVEVRLMPGDRPRMLGGREGQER